MRDQGQRHKVFYPRQGNLGALVSLFAFVFALNGCGKVADLSTTAAKANDLSLQTTDVSGIQVGEVSISLITQGGTLPLTFAIVDGELPSGLSLDKSSGSITGTIVPKLGGSAYTFTVAVTDAALTSVKRTYSGKVAAGSSALVIHTSEISQIAAGISYSYSLAATGGTAPYLFSVVGGELPSGLTLNASSGLISGIPAGSTSGQAFAFNITVTDANGLTASKPFSGTVLASASSTLTMVTTSIPTPAAGSSYLAAIGAVGGLLPYTYSISSGTLPTGLSMSSSTGLITGTAAFSTTGASYSFIATVTDAAGLAVSRAFSGFVTAYTVSLVPATFANGTPASPYSATLSTVNGQAPYTYALVSGTLPSGLSLNSSSGVLAGTVAASEAGLTKTFRIRTTDANSVTTFNDYTFTTGSYAVTLTTASLAAAVEGVAYSNSSTALAATGGTAPYTYEYSGSLPSGVGLTSSGTFFGTPSSGSGAVAGTAYSIQVWARDSVNRLSASSTLSITVTVTTPAVAAGTPSNATIGSSYSYSFSATGGRSPYTYAITSGSLPSGLTMSSAGTVSGTASSSVACPAGQFNIAVTDALSQTSAASTKCITTVTGVNVTSTGFPTAVIGTNYNATITASGGTLPYTYSASAALPVGLTVNSTTGAITGFTNASVGDYSVYITVTDSSSPQLSGTRLYTFSVQNILTVSTTTLPRAATSVAYNSGSGYSLSASGGSSPYTYAIVSGSLPSGLSMSSAGLISGTPASTTAANGGAYIIGVQASDASGQTSATASLTLNVSVKPSIATITLPLAVLNVPYQADLQRMGGVNQFNGSSQASRLTWAITGLPTGLSYSTTSGRIYGTPTTNAGSPYTVNVTVTDQHGFTGSKSLTLSVNASGKTLDLKTPRYSDPCNGSTTCNPSRFTIAKIMGTSQQFAIYQRSDTSPVSLQIAKIDSKGRVPLAGSNVTSINVALPANITAVGYIRTADFDQDGKRDIAFTTQSPNQLCIMWNAGTVNTYGMPTGFTAASTNCFVIPTANDAGHTPVAFEVKNNLRPDSTNYGKEDVIISSSGSSPNAGGTTIFALLNTCALGGSCTSSAARGAIFSGYTTVTGNVTSGSAVISGVASTAGVQTGMLITGVGIPNGATVSSFVANTSITISANATVTGTGVTLSTPTAVQFTGTTTSGSPTITAVASTAGISVGQVVANANFSAGAQVVSIVTNTSITLNFNATASGAGVTTTVFGPSGHTPILITPNSTMRDNYNINSGYFLGVAPNPPTTYADGAAKCPAIVTGGLQRSSTGVTWGYVLRQQWTGSQCQGDFSQHASTDEVQLSASGTAYASNFAIADYNNDGISDMAVGLQSPATSSANVKVYLPAGGGTSFSGSTVITSQVQSRGTSTTGVGKVMAYCIDGSSSCSYPALLAFCNRENSVGYSGSFGCLAVLPNQCSTSGCSTPFESGTPAARIDYGASLGFNQDPVAAPLISTATLTPTGTLTSGSAVISSVSSLSGVSVGQPITGNGIPSFSYIVSLGASSITINQNALSSGTITLSIPNVPTRNDIAWMGFDATANLNAAYFSVYPRNGSSSTDPFKASQFLDTFPASYLQNSEVGALKLGDMNGDGILDLFNFAVNNSVVSTFVSSTGSPNYNLGSGIPPNYLSAPSSNGCPAGAANCFPDPVFNNIGVTMGYPNVWHTQNSMDVMDFNNDGVSDVVVTGYYSQGIAVALGSANGSLSDSVLYDVGSSASVKPQGVVAADLDQDGIPDLAVVGINTSGTATGFASWLKGKGDGTFATAQYINTILGGCADPRALSAVDLDGDGRPELAVLCATTQLLYVSRLHSNGSWIAQTGPTINLGGGATGTVMKWGRLTTSSATATDLVVGGLDVVNSIRPINNVSITVTSASTGAFTINSSPASYIQAYGYVADADIADLDGDGYGDFVFTAQSQSSTNTMIGSIFYACRTTGVGTSACEPFGMESPAATAITTGDTTGDGLPEVFVGYRGTGRLINRTISRVLNTSY